MSDTHDRLPMIDAAVGLFADRGVAAVIHAGDFVAPFAVKRLLCYAGPLYCTYGNNDGEREGLKKLLPQVVEGPLWAELGERLVLVHHYIEWCSPGDVARAEIIVTGHTHEVVNRFEGAKLFLNPGECCGWVNGRCTVAILDTEGPSAEVFELDSR